MTELEKAKIAYSDATINLEVAQNVHRDARAKVVDAINKSRQVPEVEAVPEEDK